MTAGLKIEHLVRSFGSVRAVDDVSFTVGSGEFVTLLGPSGCGKTTTLRCIAGLERPTAGRISLGDRVLSDAASDSFVPPNKRHFGMVFQSYAIWPHMSVRENVAYPLKVRGGLPAQEITERVLAKLEMVGLAGLEDRSPAQLSGGQQQRVALARAIVMEPAALLFDEPLSNLDARLRERMRFELVEIQARLGVPAVYVTHDQAEAMAMSHKVIVMSGGSIAQSGPPESIYDRPANRFVADFIGNCNLIPATVVASAGAGRFTIRSALGDMLAIPEGEFAPGDPAILLLRPEHIGLAAEPVAGANNFPATVMRRYFLGAYAEILCRAGSVELRVQAGTAASLTPGREMQASLTIADCKIIRES